MNGAGDLEAARPAAQPDLQIAGNRASTKQATSSAITQVQGNNVIRAQKTAKELAERASAEPDTLGEVIAEGQHLEASRGLQHGEAVRRNANDMHASGQALSDNDDADSGDEEEQ